MQRIRDFFSDYGTELLVCLAGFALVGLLLWFRLGSLTFGNAAGVELLSRQQGSSLTGIIEQPLNAPYTLMQRAVMATGHSGITSMRLVSTLWGILAMVLFYFVARQWHSTRVAGLATWLFISTSWFLHTARLATPEILWLVSVLGLVMLFTPSKNPQLNRYLLPLFLAALSILLYVPGVVWLVITSAIVQRRKLTQAWRSTSSLLLRVLSVVLSATLIAPLILAFMRDRSLVRTWAGIDGPLGSATDILWRLVEVPKNLFLFGPDDPVRWLGQLPLLGVFEMLMFILGIFFYLNHYTAARARFIILLSFIAWLVIAVGGLASLSLIVPVIYLFVATGIAFILRQWLQVFPNNPLARGLGILVITAAVLLTSVYQTRSYFVAWRYSPETAQVFTQRL